jgi:hypothetical protein
MLFISTKHASILRERLIHFSPGYDQPVTVLADLPGQVFQLLPDEASILIIYRCGKSLKRLQ